MLNKLLYFIIVRPISRIPLWILYGIFKPFHFVVYYIAGYRKKVVTTNVKNAFPNKSNKEQKDIVKSFYHFFSRLMAESIRNLEISEKRLLSRMKVKNPELMDKLYAENKSVILLSSHYNNWEFLVTAQNLLFKHQAVGIGTPLSNKYWDKKINGRRERFGMHVATAKNYKEVIKSYDVPTATLVLGDQSPSNKENAFWTRFLNQDTGFFFGAEIMANQMDAAVVYASIKFVKKGYYEVVLKLVSESPRTEDYGAIIKKYVSILENDIHNEPATWLWSHKRWKMDVRLNLTEIKKVHKKRFEDKFRGH